MALGSRLGQRIVGLALVVQAVPIGGGLLIAETRRAGDAAMLLVPLSAAARRALPARVLDGRTLLLGGGVLPGSLVVRSHNPRNLPSWRDGVMALPVPARLCGGGSA